MGKTMMGGSTHEKNISMLTPEQQAMFSTILGGLGPQYMQGMQQFMQPQSQEDLEATFQKTYVQPALQAMEQQIAPAIQQRFADAGAGSSSALNQALGQAASDLSTSMGSQFGQFQQNQQLQQLQALQGFSPMLTNQTFSPLIQQQSGILGPLIQAGGQIGAAAAMSSKDVKENIRKYDKGMNELVKLDVMQYDYIKEVGGAKDKVGLIAEHVPKEMTASKDEILHVDLYGVMGLMINAIKELNERIVQLEGKEAA